jgi:hypothetical protein
MRLPHHLVGSSTGMLHFRMRVPMALQGAAHPCKALSGRCAASRPHGLARQRLMPTGRCAHRGCGADGDRWRRCALVLAEQGVVRMAGVVEPLRRAGNRPILMRPVGGAVECVWRSRLRAAVEVRDRSLGGRQVQPRLFPMAATLAAVAGMLRSGLSVMFERGCKTPFGLWTKSATRPAASLCSAFKLTLPVSCSTRLAVGRRDVGRIGQRPPRGRGEA